MSAWVGWGLAVALVVLGWWQYGWQGVVFAVTGTVFWLLLSFSRVMRTLRAAGGRPVGSTANAVMLNAGLHRGMRLLDIIKRTGSLGRRVGEGERPEVWAWADAGGDEVQAEIVDGRLEKWTLVRAAASAEASEAPAPGQPAA